MMTQGQRLEKLYEIKSCLRTCRAALVAQGKLLKRAEDDIESVSEAEAALDMCTLLIMDMKQQRPRGRKQESQAAGDAYAPEGT